MSYLPATKLSYSDGLQCATVLTDGKVMVTMADGAPWREMMKLEDWLILADGQRVQEEFIPVPKNGAVHSAAGGEFIPASKPQSRSSAADELEQEKQAVHNEWASGRQRILAAASATAEANSAISAAPPPPKIRILLSCPHTLPGPNCPICKCNSLGAKFEWRCSKNRNQTYRIAIRTKKGLLQVKSVLDGVPEMENGVYKKRMFADEAAWNASLPEHGSCALYPPDERTAIQKRVEHPLPPTLTDKEKVLSLLKRFHMLSGVYHDISATEQAERTSQTIRSLRSRLNNITMEEDTRFPTLRTYLTRTLRNHMNIKARQEEKMARMTPEEMQYKRLIFYSRGTGKLFATIGGTKKEITILGSDYNGSYYPKTCRAIVTSDGNSFQNFDEMRVDKKPDGRPMLSILYRRRNIDL